MWDYINISQQAQSGPLGRMSIFMHLTDRKPPNTCVSDLIINLIQVGAS